jgi:hypothetical protein
MYETSPWFLWTNWLPVAWIEASIIRNLIFLTYKAEINQRVRYSIILHAISLSVCFITALSTWLTREIVSGYEESWLGFILCFSRLHLLNPWNWTWTSFPFQTYLLVWILCVVMIVNILSIGTIVEFHKRRLYDTLHRDNSRMPAFFRYYRDHHAKWLIGSSALIMGIYTLVKLWKSSKIIFSCMDNQPQGNLAPSTEADIQKRDAELNPWASVWVSSMPCSDKSKTITPDQLEERVFANLCHMEFEDLSTGKLHHCDAFFPRSNVALIPQHSWVHTDLKAKFTRHNPQFIGGNFECYLYQKHSVHIPGTDFSLVWIPNGGDWKDLSDYLPLGAYGRVPARLVYKDKDGGKRVSRFATRVSMTGHRDAQFSGCEYILDWDHFNGLCMSPVITETKGPTIGAFHLGGSATNSRKGCAGLLTKKQFDEAYDALHELPALLLSKSSGSIPT